MTIYYFIFLAYHAAYSATGKVIYCSTLTIYELLEELLFKPIKAISKDN